MKLGDGLHRLLRPDLNPVLHILIERPLTVDDVLAAAPRDPAQPTSRHRQHSCPRRHGHAGDGLDKRFDEPHESGR